MNLATFTLLLLNPFLLHQVSGEDDLCHPVPSSLEEEYVVGYGSLISSVSKNNTSPDTGPNIPVNVKGFARKFNCKGGLGLSTTFLGIEQSTNSQFNGVLFKLENYESLKGFDRREKYYCRQQVPFTSIEFLTNKTISSSANLWIYVTKPEFVVWPTEDAPIVQSYVDIFLSGCLEMEATHNLTNYSDDCMTTTQGWNYPWVNDRILPRRPWVHLSNSYYVDSLIIKHIPGHFKLANVKQQITHNFKNNAGTFKNHYILFVALNLLLTFEGLHTFI